MSWSLPSNKVSLKFVHCPRCGKDYSTRENGIRRETAPIYSKKRVTKKHKR
jgi:transposase-like protein